MAATLVDISGACTCKVRILNTFPTAMSIKQDAVVGQAVPIEGKPIILAQEENISEAQNLHSIRQIDRLKPEEIVDRTTTVTARRVMSEGNTILPDHLVELHKRATQNLDIGESQKVAELALQGLQWLTCIDDIIIFGKDFNKHITRVKQVLERMRLAGLKLKPSKCEMLQTEVGFLGHVVVQVLNQAKTNIAKIVDWPKPRNAKQVKQFVAMGSY